MPKVIGEKKTRIHKEVQKQGNPINVYLTVP